jgi:hypothetical protein
MSIFILPCHPVLQLISQLATCAPSVGKTLRSMAYAVMRSMSPLCITLYFLNNFFNKSP